MIVREGLAMSMAWTRKVAGRRMTRVREDTSPFATEYGSRADRASATVASCAIISRMRAAM
jgi:hypothetical protein